MASLVVWSSAFRRFEWLGRVNAELRTSIDEDKHRCRLSGFHHILKFPVAVGGGLSLAETFGTDSTKLRRKLLFTA